MNAKPVVSWHGRTSLSQKLQQAIHHNLSKEPVEFEASASGSLELVHVECCFETFSREEMSLNSSFGGERRGVLGWPVVYIFSVEESLGTSPSLVLRDELTFWTQYLEHRGVAVPWIILITSEKPVDPKVSKSSSNLAEKLRSLYCPKNHDKVLVLTDPFNVQKRETAAQWRTLLNFLRIIIRDAYSVALNDLRRAMRTQEKRVSVAQLAAACDDIVSHCKSLGLYKDALEDLRVFEDRIAVLAVERRLGLSGDVLMPQLLTQPQERFAGTNLLQLHLHLFSRRCSLRLMLQQGVFIAQDAYIFINYALAQVRLLTTPPNRAALAVWTYLCAGQAAELARTQDSNYSTSLPAAQLSILSARALATLASIEPPITISTLFLPDLEDPVWKKLTSIFPDNTVVHYLEFMEMGLGVFKAKLRMREGAVLAAEVANFLVERGEDGKAEPFLQQALKTLDDNSLVSCSLYLQLVNCHKRLGRGSDLCKQKLVSVVACKDLNERERTDAWNQLTDSSDLRNADPLISCTKISFLPVGELGRLSAKVHLYSKCPVTISNLTVNLYSKAVSEFCTQKALVTLHKSESRTKIKTSTTGIGRRPSEIKDATPGLSLPSGPMFTAENVTLLPGVTSKITVTCDHCGLFQPKSLLLKLGSLKLIIPELSLNVFDRFWSEPGLKKKFTPSFSLLDDGSATSIGLCGFQEFINFQISSQSLAFASSAYVELLLEEPGSDSILSHTNLGVDLMPFGSVTLSVPVKVPLSEKFTEPLPLSFSLHLPGWVKFMFSRCFCQPLTFTTESVVQLQGSHKDQYLVSVLITVNDALCNEKLELVSVSLNLSEWKLIGCEKGILTAGSQFSLLAMGPSLLSDLTLSADFVCLRTGQCATFCYDVSFKVGRSNSVPCTQ